MLKTLPLCNSILYKKRTFLTFILSEHDVIACRTSNDTYNVIDIMTFCNFNVI